MWMVEKVRKLTESGSANFSTVEDLKKTLKWWWTVWSMQTSGWVVEKAYAPTKYMIIFKTYNNNH